MEYSQKPLLSLIKEGAISTEKEKPLHIETVISNVFVFPENVYKVYKNDNEFFNKGFRDLSGKTGRFEFTRKDFEWNHTLSPSIYVNLQGTRINNGVVTLGSPDDTADELVFIMNRVDTSMVLLERLMRGEITEKDCFSIGEQLAQSLAKVRETKLPVQDYLALSKERVADLRKWISSVKDDISIEESGSYCDFLNLFQNKNPELFAQMGKELANAGDVHGYNGVYEGGKLSLMDTFPPKEDWRTEHHLVPFYRMGADIQGIGGNKELFEAYISGYEKGANIKIDRRLDDYYIVYGAGIMVSYLYMLKNTDPDKGRAAVKYHTFLRDYFASIK